MKKAVATLEITYEDEASADELKEIEQAIWSMLDSQVPVNENTPWTEEYNLSVDNKEITED